MNRGRDDPFFFGKHLIELANALHALVCAGGIDHEAGRYASGSGLAGVPTFVVPYSLPELLDDQFPVRSNSRAVRLAVLLMVVPPEFAEFTQTVPPGAASWSECRTVFAPTKSST